MTKIDIFSGFLGAGKTTLIKKLITEAFAGQQVVLIENEFGEIGIDGGFLKESGIQINELNAGCICCSLVGDFRTALQQVVEQYHPDRIVIEPSGVGKLSDVTRAVEGVAEHLDVQLNSFVTVADVNKVKMYMKNFGEFYDDQISHASCILLSRTQTASEEKIAAAVAMLREKNPTATIVTTAWDHLTGEQILKAMSTKDDFKAELIAMAAKANEEHAHEDEEEEHEHHHHHDHENGVCSYGHHHDHDDDDDDETPSPGSKGGGGDAALLSMLKSLRKDLSRKLNLQPWIIFGDPALEDMSILYPITYEELHNCQGVGEGKARKYGKEFLDLIRRYVDENDITRPEDFVVKSAPTKSADKIFIIQSIDRRMSLEDIAEAKGLELDDLVGEIEGIVSFGTKLDLNYYISQAIDDDVVDDIYAYFKNEATSDSVEEAVKVLGSDYEEMEIRLVRIKFLCEIAS